MDAMVWVEYSGRSPEPDETEDESGSQPSHRSQRSAAWNTTRIEASPTLRPLQNICRTHPRPKTPGSQPQKLG